MTQPHNFRVLSGEDLWQALPMREAIEAMRDAFLTLSSGAITMPQRTHIDVAKSVGTALIMPSYSERFGRVATKMVNVFPNNPKQSLPSIQGIVCLMDSATGTPLALLNGTALTALRTGAASGLATDLLARPDAVRVAILGAGVQARTQLEAVCAVRPVQKVGVFDVVAKASETFAKDMSEALGVGVTMASSAREAVHSADIICTATVASTPVFKHADIPAGVHINAIGSYQPQVQEIPEETVLAASVFVDHRESALEETGDLIIPLNKGLMQATHIQAELGDILAGKAAARKSDREITLFKSVGVAIQDLAAATRAFETAEAKDLGTMVSL